jgi:opacity protein-like surface antigen
MSSAARSGSCWKRTRHATIAAALVAAATAAAPAAHAEDSFECGLKEVAGVPEADAQTATRLLCEQLRRESGGRGAFDVSIATLGRLVLVTAARQDTRLSVTVQVDGLEELPVAAGRIAQALAHGRPFSSTERVDNLVRSETRRPLSKKGSVKFSLAVADVESLGHGARGSGFALGLAYTAPRFALPMEMRFGWDDAEYGQRSLSLFSLSVGGRAYLTTRDTSPFVGAGLGYLHLSASEGTYDSRSGFFDGRHRGVSPYLEGGVEFLRTHHGRLALQVRADLPTGSLRGFDYGSYDWSGAYDGYGGPRTSPARRYIVPVAIGVCVAF